MHNTLRISGLIPATFTPMHDDGRLNLAQVEPLVERLVAHGASALFVCGSTGEAASLSTHERKVVLEAFIAASGGRLPVIAHVGHTALVEARELAAHAQRAGAAAFAALPPFYFRPVSVDMLVTCMADIAGAAGSLPFYYYHIPQLSGVALDMTAFLTKAADRIPNLAGIKYTAPTLYEFQTCAALDNGRFDLLFGVDEMLLSGLAAGARGAVGSTYNLAPSLYQSVISRFAAGDHAAAQNLQGLSARMVQVVTNARPLPALKSMMKLVGIDCGPTRLPLAAMSTDEFESLRRELAEIGFLDWMR
jgi:N-acetylneuraminate lyase